LLPHFGIEGYGIEQYWDGYFRHGRIELFSPNTSTFAPNPPPRDKHDFYEMGKEIILLIIDRRGRGDRVVSVR